jgi:hypothetical protein
MKTQKFACALFSLAFLCSCLFEEEAEPENESLSNLVAVSSSSDDNGTPSVPSSSSSEDLSSSSVASNSNSVDPAGPSILDCPLEDLEKVGKYPLPENDPPLPDPDKPMPWGWCAPSPLELSVEELSFNTQGEVRCVTSSGYVSLNGNGCRGETMLVSDSINNPPQFIGVTRFKRLVCPWFTATDVSISSENDRRTLHISVNKNETKKEREASVFFSLGNCASGVKITQSAD